MASCTVCANAPARALLEGALMSGNTPIQAWREHLEALNIGLSSVYRHIRAKHGKLPMVPTWIGDSTTGDIVADLSTLRASHLEERDRAIARGDHVTAAREGSAAQTAMATLLRAGVEDDTMGATVRYYEAISRAIGRASRNDPNHARALATAARELRLSDVADDADELAANITAYLANRIPKE